MLNVKETALPGVLLLTPKVFGDARGFFLQTYQQPEYQKLGLPEFVQDNHSRSTQGVLRGLHFQLQQPQGKLVRAARGQIFDVAVDVRVGSPTFGQWVGAFLDDETHQQLYVPPDFAHGFLVLSEVADVIYQCTNYYHPQSEQSLRYDDQQIGIVWPSVAVAHQLSDKDRVAQTLLEKQQNGTLPNYMP